MRRETLGPVSWHVCEVALADLGARVQVGNTPLGDDILSFTYQDGFLELRGRLGTLVGLESQLARRGGDSILRSVEHFPEENGGEGSYVLHEVSAESAFERDSGSTHIDYQDVGAWLQERQPAPALRVLPAYRIRAGQLLRPKVASESHTVSVISVPRPTWRVEESKPRKGRAFVVHANDVPVIKASAREEMLEGVRTLVVRSRLLDKTYEASAAGELVHELCIQPLKPQIPVQLRNPPGTFLVR